MAKLLNWLKPKPRPQPEPEPRPTLPTFTKDIYAQFMEANVYFTRQQQIDEYRARLPIHLLSRCPFCGQPLSYRFDSLSLAGIWWENGPNMNPPESACPHFFVLQGALNLNGHSPDETNIKRSPEPRVGPDVPFVIPRLMKLPSMVAVIHRLTVRDRYAAYPIGYFADPRPSDRHNTPAWTCNEYSPDGWFNRNARWSMRNDAYDYELGPYIAAGQVRWLDPDDPEHPLRQGQPPDCPYYNLPGARQVQAIFKGQVFYAGNPDGATPPDPFNLREGRDG